LVALTLGLRGSRAEISGAGDNSGANTGGIRDDSEIERRFKEPHVLWGDFERIECM
jgi:hypothetical protein